MNKVKVAFTLMWQAVNMYSFVLFIHKGDTYRALIIFALLVWSTLEVYKFLPRRVSK